MAIEWRAARRNDYALVGGNLYASRAGQNGARVDSKGCKLTVVKGEEAVRRSRDLVPVAWDRDQLISWINRYLDDPSLYASQRSTIAAEWVQYQDGRSAERLAEAIVRHACASR